MTCWSCFSSIRGRCSRGSASSRRSGGSTTWAIQTWWMSASNTCAISSNLAGAPDSYRRSAALATRSADERLLRLGMSLRTRLTLWYGALLALTLLAFSALLYFTLQQSLSSSMDERLTLRADQLRREVGPSLGNLLQPEDVTPGPLSTLGEFVEPGIYVQLLSTKGAVLAAP